MHTGHNYTNKTEKLCSGNVYIIPLCRDIRGGFDQMRSHVSLGVSLIPSDRLICSNCKQNVV